jgi:hypothetical protein
VHRRRLWILEGETVDYLAATTGFPGLGLILRQDTELIGAGAVSGRETRYAITSLRADAVSPGRLLALWRGHWGVENGLHFVKDRWWDEDRQWSRRPGLAERLAALRDSALAVLRLAPGLPEDQPLRARADHLGRNPKKALNLIGALE